MELSVRYFVKGHSKYNNRTSMLLNVKYSMEIFTERNHERPNIVVASGEEEQRNGAYARTCDGRSVVEFATTRKGDQKE